MFELLLEEQTALHGFRDGEMFRQGSKLVDVAIGKVRGAAEAGRAFSAGGSLNGLWSSNDKRTQPFSGRVWHVAAFASLKLYPAFPLSHKRHPTLKAQEQQYPFQRCCTWALSVGCLFPYRRCKIGPTKRQYGNTDY
jgi:hypothetical protein